MRMNGSMVFFSSFEGNGYKAPRLLRYMHGLSQKGVRLKFHGLPPQTDRNNWPSGVSQATDDRIAAKFKEIFVKISEPFGLSSLGRYVGVRVLCFRACCANILSEADVLFTQPYMYPLVKAAKKQGISVVLESDSDYPSFMWLQLMERHKANNLRFRDRDPWNFWPYVGLALKSIELADRIVVFGEHAYQTYLDAGVPKEKLHLGFPAPPEFCDPPSETTENPEFVWSGNHGVRKGIDLVEQAWARYKEEGGQGILHICGKISPSQKAIRMRLSHLPNVIDHGSINLVAFFSQKKRVFLSPSFSEGLPRSLIEGMACGSAIIGSFAGTGGMLEEGKNGWLIELNSNDLLRALWVAERNWDKVDQMGTYAARSVLEKTEGYYDSVCGLIADLATQPSSEKSQ